MHLTEEEFLRHIYIVGKTGVGKSTLLENLLLNHIENNAPAIFLDPHGTSAQRIIDAVPSGKTDNIVYLNLSDKDYAVGLNPLLTTDDKALTATNLVSSFKSIWWPTTHYPLTEWILFHAIYAALHLAAPTLHDVRRTLSNKKFQQGLVDKILYRPALDFWVEDYPGLTDKDIKEASRSIKNKLGQFLMFPQINATVSQTHPRTSLSDIIENKKVLVANLAKGHIGEEACYLMGSLLISQIFSTALNRSQYHPFYVIIDEFQSFGTTVISRILSEARKYGLSLTIAHQFTEQLSDYARASILGNASTIIAYKVSPADANLLAPLFDYDERDFSPSALTGQHPFQAWIKRDLSLSQNKIEMMPPHSETANRAQIIIERSRRLYAHKIDTITQNERRAKKSAQASRLPTTFARRW